MLDVVAVVNEMPLRCDVGTEASNIVVVAADGGDKVEDLAKLLNSEDSSGRGRSALDTNLGMLDLTKADANSVALGRIAASGTIIPRGHI